MMSTLRLIALALVAAAAAACHEAEAGKESAAPPEERPAAAASAPTDLHTLLESMNAMVGEPHSLSALSSWENQIDAGLRSVDDFIDTLVESPALGERIAPNLIFSSFLNIRNYYALPSAFILKSAERGGKTVYYLREPCSAEKAERVHPWWAPATELLVCPDSHRPGKWTMSPDEHSYRSRMPLSCDSQVGSPEKESAPLCGCGPNLIRCLRDEDHYEALHASMEEELRATTAYVIEHDLPLETLFTGTSTVRDANVEYLYRRRTISALHIADAAAQLADLKNWPEAGKWAKRAELSAGQHAGLLTSPQLLTWLPDRRQRQRGIFEMMWCEGKSSFGATTEQVFELNEGTGNLAFVHDTWKKLAHTELCTDCHARLDYGFQFWLGYPDARAGTHFVPELAPKGSGPLYGDDIDDPRGSAKLTPRAFAELAAAQPEFPACMTQHVVSYVLGPAASSTEREAVAGAFAERHAFRDMVRVALRLFAERAQKPAAAPTAPAGSAEVVKASAPDLVRVPPPLRAALDEHCVHCHGDTPYEPGSSPWGIAYDLSAAELPRPLLVRAADHVAYEKMPPQPDALSRAERTAVVDALLAALWPDPAERKAARAYHLGSQPLPAQQIDNALSLVAGSAGADPKLEWGALERTLYPNQAVVTPGFVATTALEALAACKDAGRAEGRALRICLREALDRSHLVRIPPR